MNILKQAKEILAERDPQEKDNLLEQLSQVLEYYHELNEAEVIEAVRLLLPAALQEDDKVAGEAFFSTINTAVVHHDIGDRIDWDALAASLSSLEEWNVQYALNVLGISGQVKYLPILNEYAHYTDPEISKRAQEAIREIKYQVARTSNSRKAG